ncbi:putative transcription factor C2H2 family [Helianthus anomalus]
MKAIVEQVTYEGDKIRVLPCQHEYHALCVDKWLKEVNGYFFSIAMLRVICSGCLFDSDRVKQ